MTVLQADQVTKQYRMGDVIVSALDAVDFRVEKGEFVAIMGPSGSGKSTLLKMAAGRVKQLGGTANIYGDKYVGGTHLVYILQEKPAVYAALIQNPSFPITVMAWKNWLKPLALLAGGGVIGGAFLHYILHGPKLPDEPGSHKAEGGE